jgi:hypothetical protein
MKLFSTSFILLLFLSSCTPTQQTEQKHYLSVFQDENATFRGLNLKEDKKKIQILNEKFAPLYDDLLGLKYEYPLAEGRMTAEYYIDNLRTGRESNQISSIIVKIDWQDEMGAAKLYEEIQRKFTQKYGFPTGNYGDWLWESAAYQMNIYLRLSADKNKIQVQFVEKV